MSKLAGGYINIKTRGRQFKGDMHIHDFINCKICSKLNMSNAPFHETILISKFVFFCSMRPWYLMHLPGMRIVSSPECSQLCIKTGTTREQTFDKGQTVANRVLGNATKEQPRIIVSCDFPPCVRRHKDSYLATFRLRIDEHGELHKSANRK